MQTSDQLECTKEITEKKHRAILAALTGNIIWGFSFLFTKMALQVMPMPSVILSTRFIVAFIILTVLILTKKASFSIKGKKLGPIIILSIIEPLCFLFEGYGVLYTNATFAGVVMAASPIVSIIFAAVFLKEIPRIVQLLFCLLPSAGVIIITIDGKELGIVAPIGVILLICNCFAISVYRIVNKKSGQEFSAFERTYAVVVVGLVAFTTMALVQLKGNIRGYIEPLKEPKYLFALTMLSIFCSILAYLLANYGAARLSVAKMATIGTIQTICATFAGVVILKEPISWAILLGAVLIIFGVWQVTRLGE
jgi:drug/metabolite transporter (DMT)-like permease